MILDEQTLKKVTEEQLFIRRKDWFGFWVWNKTIKSFLIVCKDGKVLDIMDTEDVYGTLLNLVADDWEIITDHHLKHRLNTYNFSGTIAQRYLKQGLVVKRKHWKNEFISRCKTHIESNDMNIDKYLDVLTTININHRDMVPFVFSNLESDACDWVLCFDHYLINYYFGEIKNDSDELQYKEMLVSTFKSKLLDFLKAKFSIETVKYQYLDDFKCIIVKLKEKDVDNYFLLSVKIQNEVAFEYVKQYVNMLLLKK